MYLPITISTYYTYMGGSKKTSAIFSIKLQLQGEKYRTISTVMHIIVVVGVKFRMANTVTN